MKIRNNQAVSFIDQRSGTARNSNAPLGISFSQRGHDPYGSSQSRLVDFFAPLTLTSGRRCGDAEKRRARQKRKDDPKIDPSLHEFATSAYR
jgi:hypothetical protein